MAKKTTAKPGATAPSKSVFADILFKIGYRFSLPKVFEDFLTMAIAACTQNLQTKVSWYEDEYLETIAYYKDSELRHEFPNLFAALIIEMEERVGSSQGNDVLGDFFEQHISNGRNGQFYTPFPICEFVAAAICGEVKVDEPKEEPLRVLDPTCGSGRMLLAAHKRTEMKYEYYGIDIDRTCVKMAALNLFLNGMWDSEIMCADALRPEDFVFSYRISLLPLGIFKIEDKHRSPLWHLHRNSFQRKESIKSGESISFDKTPFNERKKDQSTQLHLF